MYRAAAAAKFSASRMNARHAPAVSFIGVGVASTMTRPRLSVGHGASVTQSPLTKTQTGASTDGSAGAAWTMTRPRLSVGHGTSVVQRPSTETQTGALTGGS